MSCGTIGLYYFVVHQDPIGLKMVLRSVVDNSVHLYYRSRIWAPILLLMLADFQQTTCDNCAKGDVQKKAKGVRSGDRQDYRFLFTNGLS